MKRGNALLKQTKRTRASVLLGLASKRKPIAVVVRETPYTNRKGRRILELVRTTYVIRLGTKALYGRKAAAPKNRLKNAPRAIRPKKF